MGNSIKKVLPAALLGLASLALTPCYAQSGASPGAWMGGKMDTNFYIGANVGQSRFRTTCEDVPVSCDDKDVGWKVFAGYQFHRNFAVEAGYFSMGKAAADGVVGGAAVSATAKMRGWEVLGVAMFPVAQQIALYGKLGVAASRVTVSGSAAGGGFTFATSTKDDSTDLTFGLGAQYSFARNVAARLEWQRYDSVGGDTTGKDDVDLFSLGLIYRF